MTSSTFFFVFIPLLAIILLAVNLIFAPHNPYQEKDSVFECGFHSFLGQNRTQFSISFFIFALLFLLFDLEILLVYPYVVSAHTNEIYGLVIMLIFFLALTLGFAFELGKNALKIDSRQMVALNKEAVSLTSSLSGFFRFKRFNHRRFLRHLNKIPNKRTFYYPRLKNNGLIASLDANELVDLYIVKNKEQIENMYIVSCFKIRTTHQTMGRTVFSIRRKFEKYYLNVVRAEGSNIYLEDGRVIFDASCGAAVNCLGHTNARVAKVMDDIQKSGLAYFSSAMFLTDHPEKLAIELLKGTDNKMNMVYITGSGSEAVESLIKVTMHYFYCLNPNTTRTIFLSRNESYHGASTGALALSNMGVRKEPYNRWLTTKVHSVSSCDPYHQQLEGESDHAFVERKKAELEAKFQELGPENIAGFLVEPVVGAAKGAVPFVPGYLKAMQEVCHKHGALFMVDEVMCGMGRTGFLHAWQAEKDFVPDLQVVAKGLAGGFISVSALFLHKKVVDVLKTGKTKSFIHAQTFQGSPLQAATALAVQQIVREEGLVENAAKMGADLMNKLKLALDKHPHVGNIRGRGLFIGIEFVADKTTKKSFDPKLNIAEKLSTLALLPPYNISLYPGSGGVDGIRGDHFIIAPAYNINVKDVDHIVSVVSKLIHDAFKPSTYLERKYANLKNVYYSLNNKSKNFLDRKKKR